MDIEDLMKGGGDQSPPRSKPTSRAFTIRKNFQKKNAQNKMYDQNLIDKEEINHDQMIPGTQSVYVKTFGCSHNASDSEYMMGLLVEYGYKLVTDPFEADLIIINSCTVKNPSQEALMRMVFESKEIKKPVIVAGCVPQGDKYIVGLQDVSIIGITQIDRIVEVAEETLKGNSIQLLEKKELPSLDLPKIRKNKYIEIIPINTGCLGNCTYCKTKHARGILGSYFPDEILKRMLRAVEEGCTEIWLTSEDTGAWGLDIGSDIAQLLKLLVSNIPENVMLRIGMTNPPYILNQLESIAKSLNHPRVFSFLHIPVQSGSNITLERMNREYTREEFMKVCDYLLQHVPDMTIATDIITGFPGESYEDHLETMTLLENYKLPVINISQFYPRPGTVAAKMKQCQGADKKKRSKEVTQFFESYRNTDMFQDRIERVYINEAENTKKHGLKLTGHTKNYSKVVLDYDADLLGYFFYL
jgi:threonylcarbamoyladenosine tRNA methylthiotransferase CDKAL1